MSSLELLTHHCGLGYTCIDKAIAQASVTVLRILEGRKDRRHGRYPAVTVTHPRDSIINAKEQ